MKIQPVKLYPKKKLESRETEIQLKCLEIGKRPNL